MRKSSSHRFFNAGAARGQSGFAMISAMVGVAFVTTLLYFLSDHLITLTKLTHRNANLTHGRMVLHSITDYTINGIKQQWCFDNYWLQASPCNIDHPGSVERLVMSAEGERNALLIRPGFSPLNEIRASVDLIGMLPAHPLYTIMQEVQGLGDFATADIVIRRDYRPQLSVGGRERFLVMDLAIRDSAGDVVTIQGLPLTLRAHFGVFARELSTFGLIVANDLRLDMGYSAAPPEPGDAIIHQFAAKSQAAGWLGLVFESPIFVNGNIHLPIQPANAGVATDPPYSPVVFADKVHLGMGNIMRSGVLFRPRTAGGARDQSWNHVEEFGGFQKGVEVDGSRDEGLDFLRGAITDSVDEERLQRLCSDYVGVISRLERTGESRVAGVPLGGTLSSGMRYRLGFTENNWIVPQRINNVDGWIGEFGLRAFQPNSNTQAGNQLGGSAEIQMSRGSVGQSFRMSYQPPPSPEIPVQRAAIANLRTQLAQAEAALAAAQAAMPVDAAEVARLTAEIARINQEITTRQARLDFLLEVASRRAEVEIRLEPSRIVMPDNANPQTQPVYVDMVVSVNPPDGFVNSEGLPLSFQIQSRLFDIGCEAGRCREERINELCGRGNRGRGLGRLLNRGREEEDCRERREEILGDGDFSQTGYLVFNSNGQAVNPPTGVARDANGGNVSTDIPDQTVNWNDLASSCTYRNTRGFSPTDWERDYTPSTAVSWNFAPLVGGGAGASPRTGIEEYRAGADLIFNSTNASYRGVGQPPRFHVASLVNECRVEASATVVAGFLNCRRLVIGARTAPLRMIGTFIVGSLQIDPSAFEAGIRWASIYHPSANAELAANEVLRDPTTGACAAAFARSPQWSPFPAICELAENYSNNVLSLRALAEPFTWTTVDPDCGITNSDPTYRCTGRTRRYIVYQVSRESAL